MTMSLGNVNDAPLRYNALMLENARISFNALSANIQNHYVQESPTASAHCSWVCRLLGPTLLASSTMSALEFKTSSTSLIRALL